MRLLDIIVGNVKLRKAKVLLAAIALVLGVATVIAMSGSSRAMHAEIGTKLDEFGANILVVPKAQQLTLSYGGVSIPGVTSGSTEFSQDAVDAIKTIENYDSVSVISPKLVGVEDVGGQQSLVVGVDFGAELKMKKWWRLDGQDSTPPSSVRSTEALLGATVAGRLGKGAGDYIQIKGVELPIAAVLEPTGGPEDDLIFTGLSTAQSIFGKQGMLTFIEISALCNTCPIEDIVAQVSGVIPEARVTALKQTVLAREDVVSRFDNFAITLSVAVLAAVGLSVLVTMLSSVNERTREIGVFRAIGYRRSHIFSIVIGEAAVLGAVSGAAGYIAGQGIAGFVASEFVESAPDLPWSLPLLAAAIGLSALLGMFASTYPAWRASRIDPAEALRFI